MAQKFIIYRRFAEWESGIRFGNVSYHRELLNPDEKEGCLGGGAYVINEKQKKIICYDTSFDFGKPYFETLKFVPKEYEGWKIVYSENINDPIKDDIFKLTDEEIEYV